MKPSRSARSTNGIPGRKAPAAAGSLDPADYVTRDEALALLNVQRATLYAYVSRGRIESVPVPGSRTKLFSRRDVELLAGRAQARAGTAPRGGMAMRWGDPIMTTSLTELTAEGPKYRGHSARELAESGCTFEAVARLLWAGDMPEERLIWQIHRDGPDVDRLVRALQIPLPPDDVLKLFTLVVLALGLPRKGLDEFSDGDTLSAAQRIVFALCGCCGFLRERGGFVRPERGERLAHTLARALCADSKVSGALDKYTDLINAALILCADFELTPGSFAARIAGSAGSDLYASVAAGLSAHAGAITGRGSDRAEDLLDQNTRGTLERDLDTLRGSGRRLYGFNHPLYPKGDPRAQALIDLARQVRPMNARMKNALWFLGQAADRCSAHPALGVGLVVFCRGLGLPRRAATAIWAVARVAGHIGHVLEQRSQGTLLRPRAQYQRFAPSA